MKTSLKFLVTVLLAGSVACTIQQPISKSTPANNRSYDVDYLFEHEGCKVYRFNDMGRYIYFTNCSGDVTSVLNDSTQIRVLNARSLGLKQAER